MTKPGIFNPTASGGGGSLYPPNITNADAALASDTAIGSANVFVDGPSVSLVAGTWFVIATVLVMSTGSNAKVTAKIWDGTTISGEGENTGGAAANNAIQVVVTAVITLASTTTIKVSAALTVLGTSPLLKANPVDNSGASAKATRITATRWA